MNSTHSFDIVIAGGGVIGLSLAIELRQRGSTVLVLERGHAMQAASWAAGGMLAAMDPENPPELRALSLHSLRLYPEYLANIHQLSGIDIPLRTRQTLQRLHAVEQVAIPASAFSCTQPTHAELQFLAPSLMASPKISATEHDFFLLQEDSLDPRDLCRALPISAVAAGVELREDCAVLGIQASGDAVAVQSSHGTFHATHFVNACGAWAAQLGSHDLLAPAIPLPIVPAKGQMVSVALAVERLRCVVRIPGMYLLPRGDGRVAIGATMEYIGFDPAVHEKYQQALIEQASLLLPELRHAQVLESWMGFRPATPDGLPILGPAPLPNPRHSAESAASQIAAQNLPLAHSWLATGHFRNGILLAPASARCLAQAMRAEPVDLPLESFSWHRFASTHPHSRPAPQPPSHSIPQETWQGR